MSRSRQAPGGLRVFDVVVVGAGVAGLVTALDLAEAAPGLSIAIMDKGAVGAVGSTPLAQGGMAAAVGPDDSPALHAADTIRTGDGLCDPRAVAVMAAECPARVADLVSRGARFDHDEAGDFSLSREGGQSVFRSVRAADATGAEIFRALRGAATDAGRGRIARVQGIACEIATDGSAERRACGVWALLDAVDASPIGAAQEPGLALLRARAVVLASGGCGGLYDSTTNRDGATADGVALAWAAGAALVDCEFVQFHPTGLRVTDPVGQSRLLLTEALRGAGATLVDSAGRRFMAERHPDAELAPRHVVTKGILDQPDGAWLDATHLPRKVLETEFPTVTRGVARYGFDLAAEPVPVAPAQHYMIGGVATDLWGRTSIPALYAAGEVAVTGVHGASRMAGNSLLQSCVFGHRAALAIAGGLPDHARSTPDVPAFGDAGTLDVRAMRDELRAAMSAGAGPIRSATSLQTADKALTDAAAAIGAHPAATREAVELANLVTVGRLIVASATLRTESRGAHWREDAPGPQPAWADVHLRVARQDA